MTIREQQEKREHEVLSRYAAFSDQSTGRDRPEEQCDLRTVYQRDRDRILHCKAFRRLKHKTQVFLSPGDDHYRTRTDPYSGGVADSKDDSQITQA